MHLGKKIIVVTPAGRKETLQILSHYILSNTLVDEWHIWLNTRKNNDIKYIEYLTHPKIKIIKEDIGFDESENFITIYKFFKHAIEPDTVYIRFDDDIVWMDYYSIYNLIDFRIKNPEYFLVLGNIVNNAVCDHIHQNYCTAYDKNIFKDPFGYFYYDHFGAVCINYAIKKHWNLFNHIKSNNIEKYYHNNWTMKTEDRFSINVISWLGEEFAKFDGNVGIDEENWLTITAPQQKNKANIILGNTLFSHYAFTMQRYNLNQTNILECYRKITQNDLDFTKNYWEYLVCDCDYEELKKIFR